MRIKASQMLCIKEWWQISNLKQPVNLSNITIQKSESTNGHLARGIYLTLS
jgi:hypothetical protein